MSDQDTKNKNSKRRHADETKVKKQVKIAKQHNVGGYQSKIEKEPHRLHKHHAMDCGNPECFLCSNPRHNGSKDRLTAQEKRLFQDVEKQTDRHSNGLKNDQEDIL